MALSGLRDGGGSSIELIFSRAICYLSVVSGIYWRMLELVTGHQSSGNSCPLKISIDLHCTAMYSVVFVSCVISACHCSIEDHMDTGKTFNAIFWTLFVLMFLMRFWFGFRVWRTGERLTAERGAHQREGLWTHVTGWGFHLLLAAVVVHLWFLGGNLRRFAFPAPNWLRWAGFGLGLASVGLFVWTHAILGRFWSSYLQLRPAHRLITHGPYARIRHPMYSAILGWILSLGLVAANWVPFVFAALGALIFLFRTQGEERMMLEQFGDEYREYMERTGRLLPGGANKPKLESWPK